MMRSCGGVADSRAAVGGRDPVRIAIRNAGRHIRRERPAGPDHEAQKRARQSSLSAGDTPECRRRRGRRVPGQRLDARHPDRDEIAGIRPKTFASPGASPTWDRRAMVGSLRGRRLLPARIWQLRIEIAETVQTKVLVPGKDAQVIEIRDPAAPCHDSTAR